MTPEQRAALDRGEAVGYLPSLRAIAQQCCVPFWWHGLDAQGKYRILHNGSITLLDTGFRKFGVTADHVLAQYLLDKSCDSAISCQFGGVPFEPEKYIIARSQHYDLATITVPDVIAGASGGAFHAPPSWPIDPPRERDVILMGGYPGSLRVEGTTVADLPFQTIAGAATVAASGKVGLHVDFQKLHWPFHDAADFNQRLGGMSGGPVFRFVASPVEHMVLVGIVCEHEPLLELMLGQPASLITQEGTIASAA